MLKVVLHRQWLQKVYVICPSACLFIYPQLAGILLPVAGQSQAYSMYGLIPGPTKPKDLQPYLALLVEKLQQLWHEGTVWTLT